MPRNYRDCLDARHGRSTRLSQWYSSSCTRWTSSRRTGWRCRSAACDGCKRRATRCPSRYSTQALASTTKCCTRYTLRRLCLAHVFSSSSVSQSSPSPLPFCVDGPTRAGLVERRVWDHRERGRPVEAPDDIRQSMQPHRGHPDRGRDLHHYHFLPSRWARESERPQLGSLRAHSRVIGALKHSCARMSVEFHLF